MKERKNILLLLGLVLAVFPLCLQIYELAVWLTQVPEYFLQSFIGNVAISLLVIFLAVIQCLRNRKDIDTWVVPVAGIVVSGVCLVFSIFSSLAVLPSLLVVESLDLASFRYIVNTLVVDFNIVGIVGNILLLIGHIKSLPKRK